MIHTPFQWFGVSTVLAAISIGRGSVHIEYANSHFK